MDFNLLEPFVKASVRDKMKYMLMGNVSVMMDTGNLSVNVNLFAKKMKNGGMENVSVKLGSTYLHAKWIKKWKNRNNINCQFWVTFEAYT